MYVDMYFVVKTEKRVCSRIIWFLEFCAEV